jgi:hypothetical protein
MTWAGVLLVDLVGLALLVSLLNSVRKGRLYVGYGVIFVATVAGVMIMVSVPGLLRVTEGIVARFFPSSPLAVVGLAFHTLLLIYVLGQLTILSNRVARLVQELAIRNVLAGGPVSPSATPGATTPPASPASPTAPGPADPS